MKRLRTKGRIELTACEAKKGVLAFCRVEAGITSVGGGTTACIVGKRPKQTNATRNTGAAFFS